MYLMQDEVHSDTFRDALHAVPDGRLGPAREEDAQERESLRRGAERQQAQQRRRLALAVALVEHVNDNDERQQVLPREERPLPRVA